MIFIIGGHPRSGTTLLQILCHFHPEIAMTNEFGNFVYLGSSYEEYTRHIFNRWKRVQGKWAFDISHNSNYQMMRIANLWLVFRHLYHSRRQYQGTAVTTDSLEATYHRMFPGAKVVGDKWPHYLFRMNKFVKEENLMRVVIYRDCRDVISSFLIKARTSWKNSDWIRNVDSTEKIAKKWVQGVEMMETHADKLVILQYEALMREPEKELQRLSKALGVDPAGFPTHMINPGNIGKYKKGLTPEELDTVMAIAGPTMERLGYLS